MKHFKTTGFLLGVFISLIATLITYPIKELTGVHFSLGYLYDTPILFWIAIAIIIICIIHLFNRKDEEEKKEKI